jgi:hypothetical protein
MAGQWGAGADFIMRQSGVWLSAETIPDLAQARRQADIDAKAIYEGHMVKIRECITTDVPLDSDSLSSAARVREAEQRFGKNSVEYQNNWLGHRTNAARYVGEAERKLRPEYFHRLPQTYSLQDRDYLSFGVPITPMISRGITPLTDSDEVPRRFAEYGENATYNRMGELVMRACGVEMPADVPAEALPLRISDVLHSGSTVSVQTVSRCPKYILNRHARDLETGNERSYAGYVPERNKLMLRSMAYDPITNERYLEQMSVMGDEITGEVVNRYHELIGAIPEGTRLDETETLGLQVITTNEDGVIGMAQALDVIASELSGKNVFLGEEVDTDHPKDYSLIPIQAAERAKRQETAAEELALYAMELDIKGVDHDLGNKMVDIKLKELLLAASKKDLNIARAAFGEKTANGYKEARVARAQGDEAKARRIEEETERNAPPPDGCSGPGCEIRTVDPNTAEGEKIAKATRAKPGDTLGVNESKAKKQKCRKKGCGGQVAYAYTTSYVNYACLSCGDFKHEDTSTPKRK